LRTAQNAEQKPLQSDARTPNQSLLPAVSIIA